jgi:hypothetical protein
MKKEIKLESPDREEDITVEDVRSLETFKEWDEERISELISTLKAFSAVVYNSWSKGKKSGREIVLDSNNQTEIKIAAWVNMDLNYSKRLGKEGTSKPPQHAIA